MKRFVYYLFAFAMLSVFVFTACDKDKNEPEVDLNEDGLSEDITNLVPQEILDEMETLGMTVNGGGSPPSLAGTYYATPFILKNSNIDSDTPGYSFADYYVTFFEQDNTYLKIKYSYTNGPESGEGLGGFIVGENDEFTVFVEVVSTAYEEEVSMVHVISGKLVDDGVQDLYFANFMIDNNGNPNGYWIGDGQGRVIYDEDGFSPKTGTSKATSNKAGSAKNLKIDY
jgi:hypothetical protein